MTRLEILLERTNRKGNEVSVLNPDLQIVRDAYSRLENAKMNLRFAEAELAHAVRGLEHSDYDDVFAGWART